MPGAILVTRPKIQADIYQKILEADGYEVFAEPLLIQNNLDFEIPDTAKIQGVIFTSAAGVESYCAKAALLDMPVYTVGPQTAEAAREAGAKNVISGGGNAQDLISLIERQADPEKGSLLYVRGVHSAADLKGTLGAKGFKVESLTVYEMDEVVAFTPALISKIKSREIAAATFFSKRTAENFCKLAASHNLEAELGHIKALCISAAVLNYVHTLPWRGVYTASTPDRAGMNALIKAQLDVSKQSSKSGV